MKSFANYWVPKMAGSRAKKRREKEQRFFAEQKHRREAKRKRNTNLSLRSQPPLSRPPAAKKAAGVPRAGLLPPTSIAAEQLSSDPVVFKMRLQELLTAYKLNGGG